MEFLAEIFILLMLAIAFIQSGLDKVFDWKGNFEWLSGHFAKSPFKNMVAMNLAIVLVLELASGILSLLGIVFLLLDGSTTIALVAACLSAVTFGSLFLGQRLAKDYPGAQTIVIYLIPTFLLIYWLSH